MPSRLQVRRGYFTESDLRCFLDASRDQREELWWRLMAECGLRLGEVRSLGWYDVSALKIPVVGKGRRLRYVPTTSKVYTLVEQLRAHPEIDNDSKICPIGARAVQRRFKRCLRRARIHDRSLCPHSLRHTYASRALLAGIDIYRVGVILGHRSMLTTSGYLHTSEEDLRMAAEAIDRLGGGVCKTGSGAPEISESQEVGL